MTRCQHQHVDRQVFSSEHLDETMPNRPSTSDVPDVPILFPSDSIETVIEALSGYADELRRTAGEGRRHIMTGANVIPAVNALVQAGEETLIAEADELDTLAALVASQAPDHERPRTAP
ncbi:hypothetical protein BJF81_02355 [Ornithinimicrobium sp. CNJ-824]|uniref:hypothetical protein n=1 Tax=Ornithinimicrobium sp. CNJ-824 TaxID=1904966 RepID=UPI0009618007|nr:hypothetical protein [Ornithinimicrobium sp. CNJ-824]OLT21404.1 hypothetical protein BJF81_02355 [Ornithinimicrobium sp. CNJ-824]